MTKDIVEFNNFINDVAYRASKSRLEEVILQPWKLPFESNERISFEKKIFRNFIKNK